MKLSPEDVADLYTARRVLELAALEVLSPDDPDDLQGIEAVIVEDTLSDFPELVAEHERLVGLIRAGDTAGASTLLKQHLDDAERLLVPAVAD